jgi:predicted DNA-binding transcriptional regulator YafY
MPRKKSDKAYGEKLIWLFAELYFTGKPRSLIDLAEEMDCSKQAVIRMVNHISLAYVPIEETREGRKSYYRIPRPETPPGALSMSPAELSMLYMCQAFTRHLLGKDLFLESEKAIQKSSLLSSGKAKSDSFAAFLPGTIDYTPRQQDIRQLIKAMDEKTVCEIVYKNPMEDTGKTFYIKPYKLFAYNNALYLHAGMARYPGSRKTEFDFDPLLAVHRLEKVSLTDRKFVVPKDYNFEKQYNQAFGIIKEESFRVRLELSGYAAAYAMERRLSPDQKIKRVKRGIILTFTASSEPEVLSWVLSFGDQVKVLSPAWLVDEVVQSLEKTRKKYR